MMLSVSDAFCGGLPQAVNRMSKREQALVGQKYQWTNSEKFEYFGLSESDLAILAKTDRSVAVQMATKQGIDDPVKREQFIQAHVDHALDLSRGFKTSSVYPWTFEGSMTTVVISATTISDSSEGKYRAILTPERSMIVNDEAHLLGGQEFQPMPIRVYASKSPSWAYRGPTAIDFVYSPEDVCLLMGKNPFALYGGEWQEVSDSSDKFVAKLGGDSGDDAPFIVTVVLDKAHGYCPEKVDFVAKGRIESYEVIDYIEHGDEWMPRDVISTIERPNISRIKRSWVLNSITPVSPPRIYLRKDADALDYRLLGPNPTTGTIVQDGQREDHKYVSYQLAPLHYNIPTLEQLKAFYESDRRFSRLNQTPRYVLPSSSILLLIGTSCIIIGLLGYRKRG